MYKSAIFIVNKNILFLFFQARKFLRQIDKLMLLEESVKNI